MSSNLNVFLTSDSLFSYDLFQRGKKVDDIQEC